jgi:hypothetical protein
MAAEGEKTPFGLPAELGHPMLAAHEAQAQPDFSWSRVDHFNYVDVPGMRFFPTMGDVRAQVIRRHGYFRWLATPLIVLPFLGMMDMWNSQYAMGWKLLSIALLGVVVAVGLFGFWALGPDEKTVVGPARQGIYLYPTHLILWRPRGGDGPIRLIMKREQVLRFYRYSSGGGSGPRLMLEIRRSTGELDTLTTGLVAGSGRERAWLEQWRQSGVVTG